MKQFDDQFHTILPVWVIQFEAEFIFLVQLNLQPVAYILLGLQGQALSSHDE